MSGWIQTSKSKEEGSFTPGLGTQVNNRLKALRKQCYQVIDHNGNSIPMVETTTKHAAVATVSKALWGHSTSPVAVVGLHLKKPTEMLFYFELQWWVSYLSNHVAHLAFLSCILAVVSLSPYHLCLLLMRENCHHDFLPIYRSHVIPKGTNCPLTECIYSPALL